MTIWELTNDKLDEFAVLVDAEAGNIAGEDVFETNGKAKAWASPPKVKPYVDKRRKKQLPRADVSYLLPGALFLNAKARSVLGEFLQQFGQLLAVDCAGETEWFVNVTNLIDCIDVEKSEKTASGRTVLREVFLPNAISAAPQVFKDPHTAKTRIYVNEAAKATIEGLVAAAGLTGLGFVEPGSLYAAG